MKYHKWDSKTKAKIVMESLQNKIPLAKLCNRHQIKQSQYYYWLNEFQAKSHEAFNATKKTKIEHHLVEEVKELKRIIANLTVELKKRIRIRRRGSMKVQKRNEEILSRIRNNKAEHPFCGYRRVWAYLKY